jgi:adenine/guanine phosphoribosyltransferase-like PRPP-binding protein
VVPVDDILTTGGTLAALAARLRAGGLPVPVAAVLAATRRRTGPRTATERFCPVRPAVTRLGEFRHKVLENEG